MRLLEAESPSRGPGHWAPWRVTDSPSPYPIGAQPNAVVAQEVTEEPGVEQESPRVLTSRKDSLREQLAETAYTGYAEVLEALNGAPLPRSEPGVKESLLSMLIRRDKDTVVALPSEPVARAQHLIASPEELASELEEWLTAARLYRARQIERAHGRGFQWLLLAKPNVLADADQIYFAATQFAADRQSPVEGRVDAKALAGNEPEALSGIQAENRKSAQFSLWPFYFSKSGNPHSVNTKEYGLAVPTMLDAITCWYTARAAGLRLDVINTSVEHTNLKAGSGSWGLLGEGYGVESQADFRPAGWSSISDGRYSAVSIGAKRGGIIDHLNPHILT